MADINFMGATYTDVESVTLPKVGGGVATFSEGGGGATVEALTVTENGTYTAPSGTAYSPVTVNVAGGASNIVTGTFKGTTTGAAMDVPLDYTGSGYPVAVFVYVEGGNKGTTGFGSLIQQYAYARYIVVKNDALVTPYYTAHPTYDSAATLTEQKSSASNANSYSRSGSISTARPYYNSDACESTDHYLHIRSRTKLSVFIASTSYGFAANITYRYVVVYSS